MANIARVRSEELWEWNGLLQWGWVTSSLLWRLYCAFEARVRALSLAGLDAGPTRSQRRFYARRRQRREGKGDDNSHAMSRTRQNEEQVK